MTQLSFVFFFHVFSLGAAPTRSFHFPDESVLMTNKALLHISTVVLHWPLVAIYDITSPHSPMLAAFS